MEVIGWVVLEAEVTCLAAEIVEEVPGLVLEMGGTRSAVWAMDTVQLVLMVSCCNI